MKSIQKLQQDYNLTQKQLLIALRNCCSYYLSEEDLKPFLEKIVTTKIK